LKSNPLRPAALSAAIVLAIAATPAYANDVPAADAAVELAPVEVLGSRIRKSESEGQSPILTVTRAQLEQSGLISVGEFLQQLTSSGKALNSQFNSSGNFGAPPDGGGIGAGSVQVDLRHLEAKRVLVLVDGKRWVYESSASGVGGAVDFNTIPLSIVHRIEVLGDGASAVYGSDAIAGVINVVTRRQFEGMELIGSAGGFEQGDGRQKRAELTIGGARGPLDGLVSLGFQEQQEVASSDRDISAGLAAGPTRGSPVTPQGRFVFVGPGAPPGLCPPRDFTGDGIPDFPFCDITSAPGASPGANGAPDFPGGFVPYTDAQSFNAQPYNLVLTPSTRKSLFGSGRAQLNDQVSGYARALYNVRESRNQAAANPIVIGPETPGDGLADRIVVSRLNPFNPFGRDLIPIGQPGGTMALVARRPLEGGPRLFDQEVDTHYLNLGLEGVLAGADRDLYWDVNYIRSRSRAEQVFRNAYSLSRMQLALGDPAACAAVPGCVPLNLFGGMGPSGEGTITPEMLAWIGTTVRDGSEQALELVSGNVNGDLFDLAAGTVSFAAGFEYREQSGSFTPDAARVAGDVFDQGATVPTAGDYTVAELYGELDVPLLRDSRFAKSLDVGLASRYSDYSTFGSVSTNKFGLRWRPAETVLLRGAFAEGFRAPFIGELFGLSQFGATINDPCSNYAASGNPQLIANCQAFNIPTTYRQLSGQVFTTTGGNAQLRPETSRSITAGVVYSPAWATDSAFADNLDIELTYYRYRVEDAIQAPDAQDVLTACIASGSPDSPFCSGIERIGSGSITRFDNRLANIGRIETDGVDVGIDWTRAVGAGSLSASWVATYVRDYVATDSFGNTFSRTVGLEVNNSAIPEWTSNLRIGWTQGNIQAGWTLRYIDALVERCSDSFDNHPTLSLTALGLCSDPDFANPSLSLDRMGSTTYHDFQISWLKAFGREDLKLTLNANNVFDKDPRVCLSCSLNGYDAGTYDVPGRFWSVQAVYRLD
jgi:iron complex outermembrane receptor protein